MIELELENGNSEMDAQNKDGTISEDSRILWVRDRVLKCLGLGANYHLFDDLISQNNRYYEGKLLNFLHQDTYGVTDLDRKIISFYKTYRNETIQEEISVWEESHRAKITAIAAFTSKIRSYRLTKSAPGKVEKTEREAARLKKIKKVKKGKGKLNSELNSAMMGNSLTAVQSIASTTESDEDGTEAGSESGNNHKSDTPAPSISKHQSKSASFYETSSFTPPPGQEHKYVLTKKLIDKIVQMPYLHIICGKIDPKETDLANVNTLYFLRTSAKGLPFFKSMEDCDNQMPEYISFGTINGHLLTNLSRVLIQVFRPLVERHFQEPRTPQTREIEKLQQLHSENEVVTDCLVSPFVEPENYVRKRLMTTQKTDEADCQSVDISSRGNKNLVGRTVNSAQISAFAESESDVTESETKRSGTATGGPFKKDLEDCLDKLIHAAQRQTESIENTILSNLMAIPELSNSEITDKMLSENEKVIKQIEEAVKTVKKHIEKLLKTYKNKTVQSKRPISEYDFWNERVIELTSLYEQMQHKMMKRVLQILENVNSPLPRDFIELEKSLLKYFKESKENRQFMSTLLKEFEFIESSDSFELITEALPALMEELRIVWILSKYYCTEEKMVPLMQKIAWQLCKNVRTHLSINKLFRNDISVLLNNTAYAREMMITWKTSYLHTRKEIEISGRGSRWEFEQKQLFNETEHIIKVCNDLHQMANVAQDFYNIFRNDLKSIIKIRSLVDLMLESVDKLVAPIRDADFDIFVEFNRENWEAMTKGFYVEVMCLEKKSLSYIDRCFDNLVDSREALQVLLKMQNVKTRDVIQKQLLTKFNAIMLQFINEIDEVGNIFFKNKENPPLLGHHPIAAGCIYWKTELLNSLKDKVLYYKNVPELQNIDTKLKAFEKYLHLSVEMNKYEEDIFDKWMAKAESIAKNSMKTSILKLDEYIRDDIICELQKIHRVSTFSEISEKTISSSKRNSKDSISRRRKSVINDCKSKRKFSRESREGKSNKIQRKSSFNENLILLEQNLRFEVNFDKETFETIREAELMNNIGYVLPQILIDLCHQEDRLNEDIKAVEYFIKRYNGILDALNANKIQLLRNRLKNIEDLIYPGISRFNWNCVGIQEYCEDCDNSIKDLVSIIGQMDFMIQNINSSAVEEISSFNLFVSVTTSTTHFDLMDCKTFFHNIEIKRNELFQSMLKKYECISPLLTKLEELVEGTVTEQSEAMILFYEHYEKQILSSLTKCIRKNLEYFSSKLAGDKSIFQIDAILEQSNVCSNPSPRDIYRIILQNIRHLLNGMKIFPKWKKGTCIKYSRQTSNSTEEEIFNFFHEIISVEIINDLIQDIDVEIKSLEGECWKYLSKWKPYSNLWSNDKEQFCKEFFSSNLTLRQYDEKLTTYGNIINEIIEAPSYIDVRCIRINLIPLTTEIQTHCKKWMQLLGDHLLNKTMQSMSELQNKIDKYQGEVNLIVNDINEFRQVMKTINGIKKLTIQAEVQCDLYKKTFNTLKIHNVQYLKEDEDMAYKLEDNWKLVHAFALSRLISLTSVKLEYCEVIKENIKEFSKELQEFAENFKISGPETVGDNLDLGLEKMKQYGQIIANMEKTRINLENDEMLFDISPTDHSIFSKVKESFENMKLIFHLYEDQKNTKEMWSKILWIDCDPQSLLTDMETFIINYKRLPENVRDIKIGPVLLNKMEHFKNAILLFFELKKKAIRQRHWEKLMEEIDIYFDKSEDRFMLQNVFDMDLATHENITKTIIMTANEEANIEQSIIELEELWGNTKFTIEYDKEKGHVLTSINELNKIVEDNMIKMQTLLVSQFIGPFLLSVKKWINLMKIIINVMEVWVEFQNKWLKLGGIFVRKEFNQKLPEEAERFDEINITYKLIMADTAERCNVLACCSITDRVEQFNNLISELEVCEKSLIKYTNEKRFMFPRFNFLSDDELLEIFASSFPLDVGKFIGKIFFNLDRIKFDTIDKNQVATALVTTDGEVLEFTKVVIIEEKTEYWMKNVLLEMKRSVKSIIEEAVNDFTKIKKSYIDWISAFPGIILNIVNKIWWTAVIENNFKRMANGETEVMKIYWQELNTRLEELVDYIKAKLLTNVERKKLESIITVNIHLKNVVEILIKTNIRNAEHFEWQRQLRFYWLDDAKCIQIQQCNNSLEYGYEFMGLNKTLAVTSLSERIFLSITQALSMNLGSAILGPAGTGKTETIKDLAVTLGFLCITTNCGKYSNYYSIGKTLRGIIESGVWGCFDEFDRIKLTDLSVISTQMQTIHLCLQRKLHTFNFEGQNTRMYTKPGIFITINPTYCDRTELPDSMKTLFRYITCMVPDIELICEIQLFVNGFVTSKELAKKVTRFHKLITIRLSKRKHYDFGLKTITKVLEEANNIKRIINNLREDAAIMGAIRDINLPKLAANDITLFFELLKDIFPCLNCPKRKYPQFRKIIEQTILQQGYVIVPEQIEKLIQLQEIISTKHAVMIVGSTSSGKSVIIDVLCHAQTYLTKPTKLHILNPKAYTVNHLFGFYDLSTREWTDGLLNNIFRKINKPSVCEAEEFQFILFDGDVDAIWIENLNAVIDDNKLLTLANQERIQLQDCCKLFFEVGDLQHASPATISRLSIVYVDEKDLCHQPFLTKWINNKPECAKECLTKMCRKYLTSGLNFVLGVSNLKKAQPLEMVLTQTRLNLVTQLTCVVDALYSDQNVVESFTIENVPQNVIEETNITFYNVIEAIFIQACYYSLGALLLPESKKKFDEFMKNTSGLIQFNDSQEKLATFRCIPTLYPTLYEYTCDVPNKVWMPWKQLVPNYIHNTEKFFSNILVPTVDTVRTSWILNAMNKVGRPIILIGETGISKTAIVGEFLQKLNPEKFNTLTVNFSSRTTSIHLQKNIESIIERRTLNIYGPATGKRLIVFIDDMNVPFTDIYGSQQPIALLKLLIERGGLYDLEKDFNWKNMTDMSFIASMTRTEGKRTIIDPRFVSLFSIYNITCPNEETLNYIYTIILIEHVQNFNTNIQQIAGSIVQITLELYEIIIAHLLPIPSKFHYIFNMRDLSRIFAGILQSNPEFYQEEQQFVRLWRNEFSRIMCDRVYDAKDTHFLCKNIEEALKKRWKSQPDLLQYVFREPLLFGDFRNSSYRGKTRFYEDLLDYEAVRSLFSEILEKYNSETGGAKISMVLFEDALQHLTRVHRTLRLHRGHILVVGMNGTGKRSVIKLASFAAECEIFEIAINKGYSEARFQEDLKRLYDMAGVNNKRVVLLLAESRVVNENFFEPINSILTTGMIPALFTDKEKDIIVSRCGRASAVAGCGTTKEKVWTYFIETSVSNLHVALSMNAAYENLHKYCRDYPAFVNSTTMNWMIPWPKEAFIRIAEVILRNNTSIAKCYRINVVEHFIHVYMTMDKYTSRVFAQSKRKIYISPKHYVDSLNTYVKILDEKRGEINSRIKHLSGGLDNINEMTETLEQLHLTLKEKNEFFNVLIESSKKLVKFIQERQERFVDMQSSIMEEKNKFENHTKLIEKEQCEIGTALLEAKTNLNVAKEEIGHLKESDIANIRSYETPPELVQIICECIGVISGVDDISWNGLKDAMNEQNFVQSLREINYDLVTKKKQLIVKERLERSLEFDQIQDVSKPTYELYKFLLSVMSYCTNYKEVKSRTNKLKILEAETENLKKSLKDDDLKLKLIDIELNESKVKYTTTLEKREQTEEEIENLQKRISVLDKLINNLSSENLCWQNESKVLQVGLENLYGDCLICANFLVYCGPFLYKLRNEMIYDNWQESILDYQIPVSQPFRLEMQLSNDVKINKWFSEGLSPDELSIQNALLMSCSSKFPLCIDPQQQAFNWIKNVENDQVKICSLDDDDFIEKLKFSTTNGYSLIVQDVDVIDSVFDNLFDKNITNVTDSAIMLNAEEIHCHPNFRLYLLTNISNPIFDCSIYAKVTVIDYTITQNKLEEELLSIVVRNEQPDIEELKDTILLEIYEKQILLQQIEDELLEQVTLIRVNTLDRTDIILTLDNTKTNAGEAMTKLRVAETMSVDINRLRNNFRLVAERGSILFFTLLNMSMINSIYQYSLSNYLPIFIESICKSHPDEVISKRSENIIKLLTKMVYNYGCLGLLDRDKLLFSFEICTKIEENVGHISQSQMTFFLNGNDSDDYLEVTEEMKWLPLSNWKHIMKLTTDFPDKFSGLFEQILNEGDEWMKWFKSNSSKIAKFPFQYSETLSPFESLMLLRCFHVDHVYHGVMDYIKIIMGEYYIIPPCITLNTIYSQSVSTQPIVLILSAGSNPVLDLINLEKRCTKSGNKIKYLSLGQNQENVVIESLKLTAINGQWLVIQDCHLLIDILKRLKKELIDLGTPHPDFRLWLTIDSSFSFPYEIFQRSLKVVIESPNGLKLKMRNLYSNIQPEVMENCLHPAYKRLIYVIAFYHSVLQERSKYDKLGWNFVYNFNEADLKASFLILDNYLTKYWSSQDKRIPWNDLTYLIGEVIYGGKIMDEFDHRISATYLNEYFGDFLFDKYQPYHFYRDESCDYKLPAEDDLNSCMSSIESFPLINTSEVIYLHVNTDIRYYTQRVKGFWKNMNKLQLQIKMNNNHNNNANKYDFVMEVIRTIVTRLSFEFDIARVKRNFGLNITPVTIVLFQELKRVNKLVRKIRSTLNILEKAITGAIKMDFTLEKMISSLYSGTLPDGWTKLAPITKKCLGDWMNHLEKRLDQYTYWAGANEPIVIWLSGLHVPEAYLIALLQIACRKNNWRLENAALQSKITHFIKEEDIEERPDCGCYIQGLYIEGARWNRDENCLQRSYPKVYIEKLPILAIIINEDGKFITKNSIKTPVYTTTNRRNSTDESCVFEVDLLIRDNLPHWILQGVCLLLNTD